MMKQQAVDGKMRLRVRVACGAATAMGPGRADLLAGIRDTGSIAAAGRRMAMSYKRAWVLVEAINASFKAPLVEAVKGGAGGGGAKLTVLGAEVLQAYRGLEEAARRAGAADLAVLAAAIAVPPAPETG